MANGNGSGGSVFWKDDEIVVDREGIPHYTGNRPELMREYRKRVLFAYSSLEGDGDTEEKEKRDLKKKQKAFAKKLLNGLHGEAWRACQDLITDMAKLSEERGFQHVLSALQSIEKVTVIKKTEQFDRFFERGFRKRGQALDAYLRSRKLDWAELQELDSETKMSSDLLAYFVLKQSGLSKDDRRQILLNSGSDYNLESIEKAMRVSYYDIHEKEKISKFHDDRRGKGYGKTQKRHYAHLVDDGDTPNKEALVYEAASSNDQAFEYEHDFENDLMTEYESYMVREDEEYQDYGYEAGEMEEEGSDVGASQDEEVYQAFSAMDKQRRSYQESRRKLREVQKQRGFFKGELTFEQRRAAVQKEKERTRCSACGKIGHWAVRVEKSDVSIVPVLNLATLKPDLEEMTVRKLQDECERWGIRVSGTKKELIQRLTTLFQGHPVARKGCSKQFVMLSEEEVPGMKTPIYESPSPKVKTLETTDSTPTWGLAAAGLAVGAHLGLAVAGRVMRKAEGKSYVETPADERLFEQVYLRLGPKLTKSADSDGEPSAGRSDLVTFNVGGKIYQVLREPTLSLHPNSLLTQLAEDKQDDKEIFVEGDQDLFKYVLAYHRDRKIILPPTISMAAVQQELKRFNLDAKSEEMVLDEAYLPFMLKQIDQLAANQQKLLQDQKKQVLREPTLSLHPNSLLTQLAEDKQDDKEIFVEGDQDLFNYVLAYHRDRKIILPPNISAAAVQQELKRFGLDAKTEEMVRDGAYYPSMLKQIDQLVANQKNLLQKQQNQNAAAHLMSITAQALMEKSAKGNGEQISISFDEGFAPDYPGRPIVKNGKYTSNVIGNLKAFSSNELAFLSMLFFGVGLYGNLQFNYYDPQWAKVDAGGYFNASYIVESLLLPISFFMHIACYIQKQNGK
eukprot:g18388.t1